MPRPLRSSTSRSSTAASAATAVWLFYDGAPSFTAGGFITSRLSSGRRTKAQTSPVSVEPGPGYPGLPMTGTVAASFMLYGLMASSVHRRKKRASVGRKADTKSPDLMFAVRKMLGSEEDLLEARLADQRRTAQNLHKAMDSLKTRMGADVRNERSMKIKLHQEIKEMKDRLQNVRAKYASATDKLEAVQQTSHVKSEQLSKQISKMQAESVKSKEIASEATEKMQDQQKKLDMLQTQASRLAGANNFLQMKATKVKRQVQSEQLKAKALEQKMADEHPGTEKLRVMISKRDSEKAELKSKVSELQAAFDAQAACAAEKDADRRRLRKKIEEGWARMQALEADKRELQVKVEEGQQQVVVAETEKQRLRQALVAKDADLTTANAETTNIKEQIASMERKHDDLETEKKRLERALLDDAETTCALQDEKNELEAKLAEDADRMQAAPRIQEENTRLEKSIAQNATKIVRLETDKSNVESQLTTAEKEISEATTAWVKLEGSRQNIELALASKKAQVAALKESRQRLVETDTDSEAQMLAVAKKVISAEAELHAVQEREMALQTRLSASKDERAKMASKYKQFHMQRAEALQIEAQLEAILQAVEREQGKSTRLVELELQKAALTRKLEGLRGVQEESSSIFNICEESYEETVHLTKGLLAMKQELEDMRTKNEVVPRA